MDKDAAWQRWTNFGYFENLSVLHYNRLVEMLVKTGCLDAGDKHIKARVDEALDELLTPFNDEDYWTSLSMHARGMHTTRQRLAPDRQGTVRIKMTLELAEWLIEYEWRTGDRCRERFDNEDALKKAQAHLDDCGHRYREFRNSLESYGENGRRRLMELGCSADRACKEYWRLIPEHEMDRAEFEERLLNDRAALKRIAENYLYEWYRTSMPEAVSVPCNCKARLPECDCLHRFRHVAPVTAQKHPRAGEPLVSKELYSGRTKRWWGERRYSGSKRNDDQIIRSHDKSASVGMKGFFAGTKDAWKVNEPIAEVFPEQDDRATTRDRNKTEREGERALQKQFDDPEGTPRSWSNPADADPDNDDHITRIGDREIEETLIEPAKDKK
jgi:hypothetical protein